MLILAVGCQGTDPDPSGGDGGGESGEDFVSDNPHGGDGRGGEDDEAGTTGGGEAGDDGDGGDPSDPGAPSDDDGSREIAEADIIAVEGDRLYALSRYGGLTIVDVSDPSQLPVLGRFRANATPFEMYVDQGQVFVMLSDFGRFGWDDEAEEYVWRQSSRLVALDATDPSSIIERGSFDLPGSIQDSRRVGDVLYLVTHQNGWCWRCDSTPNTTVTSLDVSDPALVEKVDELSIESDDRWTSQRSVTSTQERLYIAGPEWSEVDDSDHSTIHVVDISDPAGFMQKGSEVTVAGQIQSRWQMDEYEGVLRVVSQPWGWDDDAAPTIETFSVAAADDIVPLASVDMVLPRPESLRSVRFDEDRGYAITFEQTDPLFTLDLSDPATPRQVGELEIPGWVYHMEPRGDRILALGFDQGNPEGAINVSLFDVGDFANPTMLERVHFGGDWAYFAEDQDRVHKSFNILADLGLLLVPFSGWDWDGESCSGGQTGGVQLIDWSEEEDTLTLRGMAPSKGASRRAIIHRERLIGVSDRAIESFDISDRDAPVALTMLPLSNSVHQVAAEGGLVARLSESWWSGSLELEIVSAADAENPQPLGRIDLSATFAEDDGACWYGWHDTQMQMHQGFVYLVRTRHDWYDYEYGYGGEDPKSPQSTIEVVDARDPSNPVHVASVEVPSLEGLRRSYYGYRRGYGVEESPVAIAGQSLLIAQFGGRYVGEGDEQVYEQLSTVQAFSLVDPALPVLTASIERPVAAAMGALQKHGGEVLSWHMEHANDSGSKVRYYLDRFDVRDPAQVTLRPEVNVPGSVVAYDPLHARAVTLDEKVSNLEMAAEECWSRPHAFEFDYDAEVCTLVRRELNLLEVGTSSARRLAIAALEDEDTSITGVTSTAERLFVTLRHGYDYWYGYGYDEDGETSSYEHPWNEVVVFDGWSGNTLTEASRVEIRAADWWYRDALAVGTQLFMQTSNGLVRIDATNAAQPVVTMQEILGYSCVMETDGVNLYCGMYDYGLQSFPLSP